MAGSLKDILASKPPRETSGSRSYNRFEYQKDWVVCKILELHASDKPYLILCDYHEDVVILDDELEPVSVDFYQIKTSQTSNWTLGSLTSRPRAKRGFPKPSSILGKLYSCYILFPDHTNALHFVSNARFAIAIRDGIDGTTQEIIHCHDISEDGATRLKKSLCKEIVGCLLPEKPSLFLEVSYLSLQDHKAHTKGKVEEFLEGVLPNQEHHTSAVYRVLSDEVARKAAHEGQISEFDLLTGRKGIGRRAVNSLLSSFSNLDDYWKDAQIRFAHEGLSPGRVQAIRHEWRQYQVERMNPDNEGLQQLQKEVQQVYLEVLGANSTASLTNSISAVSDEIQRRNRRLSKNREYIEAMAIVEAYENFKISEAHSEPKKET